MHFRLKNINGYLQSEGNKRCGQFIRCRLLERPLRR